jgi:hypothetical protein
MMICARGIKHLRAGQKESCQALKRRKPHVHSFNNGLQFAG